MLPNKLGSFGSVTSHVQEPHGERRQGRDEAPLKRGGSFGFQGHMERTDGTEALILSFHLRIAFCPLMFGGKGWG